MADTIQLTVQKTAAKKHYYHSGVTVTATTTGAISVPSGYDSVALMIGAQAKTASGSTADSRVYRGSDYTSTMPSGTSLSCTYSAGTYNYTAYAAIYRTKNGSDTYYGDVSKLSATASYVYGSKATPVISCNVTGGYLNPTVAHTIKYTSGTINYIDTQYTISSGTFYYKESSAANYTSVALSSGSVTLAANTLTAGNTYTFYAQLTMDDNTAVTTSTVTINTNETTPSVTAVSPANIVTYEAVDFDWTYSISTGTPQYAYDLQTSTDQVTWTSVASHTVSSATNYSTTVATAGTLYWRVRGYNLEDTASAWSSVLSFVNVAPPAAPTISGVSGTGRITVSWNASDQIAYQVMIGDYDSGWVYSTAKSYFLNEYLINGNYTIKVRVINAVGLASDWATTTYAQSVVSATPTATLTMREGYNEFDVTAGSFDHFYILRNGTPITKIVSGTYYDYFCNGADAYIVRGVNADDTFGDLLLTGAYTCHKPALITPANEILYVNERLDEEPTISSSKTLDVSAVNYLGRTKPVHHIGKMLTRTWSVSCSADIDTGKVYFYRNFRGDKAWVVCANVQSSLNWFGVHEYQFTLEETDYGEGIEYDV